MTTTSHAPTASDLDNLSKALERVTLNLRPHKLFHCYSHRLRKLSGHLDLIREVAEEMRREIAEELSDRHHLPRIRAEIAAGFIHDGFSLVRVTPPVEDEHPVGVGACVAEACDVAIHAAANTSLDRRPA